MSVYKRKATDGWIAETYSYDFQLRGRRFSGDTGATTDREAKRVEKREREKAKAKLAAEAEFFAAAMTFEVAASRYWLEVGQHHKNSATTFVNLEWLTRHVGAKTKLEKITDSVVASLVAKRRSERVRRIGRNGKIHLGAAVKPSTVNRTCTQPLRDIITRAKKVWKVAVADIDFGKHLLKESQERVREASPGEEEAILAELAPGYAEAVQFAFLSGCRRMEIIGLEWSQVDFFTRQFTVIGKGDKARTIPMSSAIQELLWSLKDHHPEKVFTYIAGRADKERKIDRGRRYPLTEHGLKSAMRRAVPSAGVENFRFHDTRHTAATRVLRKSNLRVVQDLLGHSDVKTTMKYAHIQQEDVRAALDAASEASCPTRNPTEARRHVGKRLKSEGK